MAQGGDGLLFRLLAFGAGQELGAGDGAGGGGGAGFSPLMGARGIFGAGTVDQVINCVVVCDGVPFGDGGFLNAAFSPRLRFNQPCTNRPWF